MYYLEYSIDKLALQVLELLNIFIKTELSPGPFMEKRDRPFTPYFT